MISVEGVTKRYGIHCGGRPGHLRRGPGRGRRFPGTQRGRKTTTMRMLTGTLQPDEGTIRFDGEPIADNLTAAKTRVGYLPEANPLYEDMLVCESSNTSPGCAASTTRKLARESAGRPRRPAGRRLFQAHQRDLEGVPPADGHGRGDPPRARDPVLDEPTEGLDPNQRVEIRKLVSSLGSERTVILSTHVMQEVEATCDRLLVISRGAIAADGTVSELMDAGRDISRYTVEAAGDGVVEALRGLPGVADHTPRRSTAAYGSAWRRRATMS